MRVRYSFGSRHTGHLLNIKKQRVKYPKVMEDVIRISDIVLQVLDARYFEEMRNLDVEGDIRAKGKKSIFVLNKADLVDIEEVRKKIPQDMRPFVFLSTKTKAGAKELRDKIKIEAKRVELGEHMTRVHVGVVGYPNVGKSSVINMITRRGVAGISKQAGFTKGMQRIRFADGILILDTPGVIPAPEYTTKEQSKLYRDARFGARTYSDVKDPEAIVHTLMTQPSFADEKNPTEEELKEANRIKRQAEAIEEFYKIDSGEDSEVLIEELGKMKNFLSKGGEVNIDRTARMILKDWQEGKIKV